MSGFMTCMTCRRVCEVNNTGICLLCQLGKMQPPPEYLEEMELKIREQQINDELNK